MKQFIWESGFIPDQGIKMSLPFLKSPPQIGSTTNYALFASFLVHLKTNFFFSPNISLCILSFKICLFSRCKLLFYFVQISI